ncbi:uncharacterized protein LOC142487664 [Ascaphus truei]|uniref:uncharacterized protein LOC142487664 n=1 Tax=Ascaphus truei TaxID=8439 RepID=UPI003F59D560
MVQDMSLQSLNDPQNCLKKNHDIVIRKADKGGALVVLSANQYRQEALRQLSNVAHYQLLKRDPTPGFLGELAEVIELDSSDISVTQGVFLLESITFLLTHNYFMFDSRFYLQLLGTAMGTSFAPSYANLFMGFWEAQFIYHINNTFRTNIIFFKRFIDDLIMIWEGDEVSLLTFINTLNQNNLNINFTFEHNIHHINYLDLLLYIDNDMTIQTEIFRKANSRNTLLRANSSHPRSLLNSIPKAQFIRLKRLCSSNDTFIKQSGEMAARFKARGYTEEIINTAFEYADSMDRTKLLNKNINKMRHTRSNTSIHDGCPIFVTTYSKQSKSIRDIINKHWATISLDRDISDITKNRPRFSYRKAKTLGTLLSPSLFDSRSNYKIQNIPQGFFTCGHCSMCCYAQPTKIIMCNSNNKKFKITSFINCNSSFVIYMLSCGCKKSYVGRTTRPLKTRIAEHVRLIKKRDSGHPVSRHFSLCPRGGIANFTFSAIEHVPCHPRGGDRVNRLNRQEMFWIHTLSTLYPSGINIDWELKHFLTT